MKDLVNELQTTRVGTTAHAEAGDEELVLYGRIGCLTEKYHSYISFEDVHDNERQTWAAPVHAAYLECWYVQLEANMAVTALLSSLRSTPRCSWPPCPLLTLPRPCPAATWRAPSRSWRGDSTSPVIWSASLTEASRSVSSSLHRCGQNIVASTPDHVCSFFFFFFSYRGMKSLEINQVLVQAALDTTFSHFNSIFTLYLWLIDECEMFLVFCCMYLVFFFAISSFRISVNLSNACWLLIQNICILQTKHWLLASC